MSWKNTQPSSLADALVVEHKSPSELDDVHNVINWRKIEKTISNLHSSKQDAPSYPPLMMCKMPLLQLLNTKQLLEPLLEQINTHLEQSSIMVSLGSINIVDATVIEATQSRKRSGKDSNNTQEHY